MTKAELKEKAKTLPLAPGVYIMHNAANAVIYVGKAKKLRNRVSQYFVDSASHSAKTRLMIADIDHFDVIVAASEFEALVLECSLIKRHMPKYNILLKDDKSYPYLRIDYRAAYPVMELASKVKEDGAKYYGPYGGRYLTQKIIDTLRLTFKLPGCKKSFPTQIGKDRPCLNFQMNNCDGWCRGIPNAEEYRTRIKQINELLQGNYKTVADSLRVQMQQAAEALEFEHATQLRDRMKAIETLGQKQLVTAGHMSDTDAVGYYQTATKGCFAVLHYIEGNLADKDYEIVPASDSENEAISTIVKQYYLKRNAAPKQILLSAAMEDAKPFSQLLSEQLGKQIKIIVPERGNNARLTALAVKNAREEAERVTTKEERLNGTMLLLQQMLNLPEIPRRIEAYDISNLSGTDIVGSMVVFQDGKQRKSDYKHFKLENMQEQDDYAAMKQVIRRRFTHFLSDDPGFNQRPDLLLIDGGMTHAKLVYDELVAMGLTFSVFGMVKDDRHRTFALETPDGLKIGLVGQQSVFAFIGNIQEEVHRFAITFNRKLRSRRVQHSELENIPGIGPKRRQLLLKRFQTLSAIKAATVQELQQYLTRDAAAAVYQYFHGEKKQ